MTVHRNKSFPVNTRLPKAFQAHLKKKYTCTTCLDTGVVLFGRVCPDCDPTTPDKEELDV